MITSPTVAPWRSFLVEVARVRRLSPSFVRVTLTAPDLDAFADNGFDQRFKVVLPLPAVGLAHWPTGADWYGEWRALPDEHRNPMRTYTVRAVRQPSREVDVDMVLHHDAGPAGAWASMVRPGEQLAILGPDAGYDGDHGGRDFHPHPSATTILLAGDETAAPAIASIVESLDASARGVALVEVPESEDAARLAAETLAPAGVRLTWLARDGAAHGSRLIPAVQRATAELLSATGGPLSATGESLSATAAGELPDVDIDGDILWEVPDQGRAGSPYGWLAGEAAVIKTLRRHLVTECGLDRRSVAFMGYWRLGRSESAD